MQIILATNAGFCFGVKRAVQSVYEHLNSSKTIYTLGPIIHNPQVVSDLEQKGVIVEECLDNIEDGTVIIRSHGIGKLAYDELRNKEVEIIDATCPFVKRIHQIVEEHYTEGYDIIIIGEREHPEVKGINGWCNGAAYILNSCDDVDKLSHIDKACVVAQTTITHEKLNNILSRLKPIVSDLKVFDTICHTTSKRQNETKELAKKVDIMLVIGGHNSSNTKKLYSICKNYCKKTFAIETAKEINNKLIRSGDIIGITAGASTPDWIIKEVIDKMDQINNQNSQENTVSMEDFEKTMVSLRNGQIVKGVVLSVNTQEAIVNIGYKADGIISADEVFLEQNQTLEDIIKVGQEIEVEVIKINDGEGNVLLSCKSIQQQKVWNDIQRGYEAGVEFRGKCTQSVKGGVIASINGIRTFVPASQLSTKYVEDLNTFVGKELRLKIIELDKRRNRLVASQRIILEAEEEAKRQSVWDSLKEGEKITGTVKSITDFGVFVDIGGIDGLIHISDLSWGHVKHPSEVLSENQQVEVIVLSFDKAKGRISLGYKQTLPQPWGNADNKYPVGSIVEGKVVRITSFGAFVELEPGVDGLVHISQISNKRINKVEDALKVGDVIDAKVLDVKPEDHKLSLSIKEAKGDNNIQPSKHDDNSSSKYKKEEMKVSLGEFFPEH
ncbi:MAG: bifunctional 4-hydroxy-3-methylbut-2-enyl diphosphate reductase/30S ribosomal protein S1 [Xylanivirga thermophila]|uniref:bifunctional 4-hydroxy-3-methylbut-2-enyl diphosphate reductase/30S ribosomal protein S1 n=1 Tax=Xylanivirga thermophila TaxID=2496273 RepID=UPI0039F4DED8